MSTSQTKKLGFIFFNHMCQDEISLDFQPIFCVSNHGVESNLRANLVCLWRWYLIEAHRKLPGCHRGYTAAEQLQGDPERVTFRKL